MPETDVAVAREDGALPDVSVVLPCYNEAACLERTVPPLVEAFRQTGRAFEIILVDNGSTDGTGAVIDRLAEAGLPIEKAVVPVNRGQGLGIRTGLNRARGRTVGYVSADGQVEPDEVVAVFQAVEQAEEPVLAKARRCDRYDGLRRKVISLGYNALIRLLFPGIGSTDVNANPKFLPAEVMRRMELCSDDWFLEAEIMLKARHLRLPVVEIPVRGRPREAGTSHVRFSAVLEFMRNMLIYRFGGPWKAWRRRTTRAAHDTQTAEAEKVSSKSLPGPRL